jgi:phosphatidylserine/phosphatidylglycerophosphate/cardiolipin synthase-like enzyme
VQLLRQSLKPLVYYCSTLHTKLYIVEAQEFRLAVIGSPNLTVAGNKLNLELALELRATTESRDDDIAVAISDLVDYARKLLLEEAVTLS